jgi:hypothetical protein
MQVNGFPSRPNHMDLCQWIPTILCCHPKFTADTLSAPKVRAVAYKKYFSCKYEYIIITSSKQQFIFHVGQNLMYNFLDPYKDIVTT